MPQNEIARIIATSELTEDQIKDVLGYQKQFHIEFNRFAVFSKTRFESLHSFQGEARNYSQTILTETDKEPEVMNHFRVLTEVANLDRPVTNVERRRYLDSLLAIYSLAASSGEDPRPLIEDEQTLVVAPQREGAILSHKMGWTADGRTSTPDAKRIPDGDGLLVGLNDLDVDRKYQRAVLVDGAIASGATLIAIMKSLLPVMREFHIYCIHTTREALNAIKAYSARHDLTIHLVAGNATQGMSSKYYALQYDRAAKRNRYVVGDLGDTIADLED